MPFSGYDLLEQALERLLYGEDLHGLEVEVLDVVLGSLRQGYSVTEAIAHARREWDL
jgi:hypothetical protein